jgi:hypothetical protein
VYLVALSDPRARLRGRDGELMPARRPCEACGALISAYAAASDRFCLLCAPRVDDEPPRDPALYCPKGHLRAEFEVVIVDRSRGSGIKKTCVECKRLRDRTRDQSGGAKAARALERRRQAA